MSYRDNDETYDGSNKRWYWTELDSLDDSYSAARKTFGGWVFAAMILLGILVTYFSGKSVADLKTPETDVPGALIGMTVELIFVLIASYRMVTERGWIISWILTAAFVYEAFLKILGGAHGVIGWLFFYVAVTASLLTGARACWDIHLRLKAGETTETLEENS